MQCPRCQTELPSTAKFCGACGHKFQVEVTADPDKKVSNRDADAGLRFFQDTTSKTDLDRNQKLKALADMAMTSAAPPSPTPSPMPASAPVVEPAPAAAPAPSSPEPVASSAAPASASDASVDPVTRQPFQFQPQELSRALGRAASGEHKPPPDASPDDVTAFYKAGEAAGIGRKTLEEALHQVAVERLKKDRAPAPVADHSVRAPLTEEFEPIQPSGKKVAAIAGGVVLALVAGGFLLLGGDEKPVTPAEVAAPKPLPVDAPAPAASDAPKRKMGSMDTKLIGPAIAAVGEKARTCHVAALKQNPKLAGKLVLDAELEEDGQFSKLEVKEDGLKDPAMVSCVKAQVRAHDWLKPQGGYFAMEFPLAFQLTDARPAAGKKGGKGKKR